MLVLSLFVLHRVAQQLFFFYNTTFVNFSLLQYDTPVYQPSASISLKIKRPALTSKDLVMCCLPTLSQSRPPFRRTQGLKDEMNVDYNNIRSERSRIDK